MVSADNDIVDRSIEKVICTTAEGISSPLPRGSSRLSQKVVENLCVLTVCDSLLASFFRHNNYQVESWEAWRRMRHAFSTLLPHGTMRRDIYRTLWQNTIAVLALWDVIKGVDDTIAGIDGLIFCTSCSISNLAYKIKFMNKRGNL